MGLKGIQHKDNCSQCKKRFDNNEKITNILTLDEEDEIKQFTILCSKCYLPTQRNNNTIMWQTIYKKPISKREFINGLSQYFFANYDSITEEKSKFIIAYLLYQQKILKIKEQNEEGIIFENPRSNKTYKITNYYGKISFKYVKTLFKNLWETLISAQSK